MERAGGKCVEWIEKYCFSGKQFTIFCGKGNNGGDGLAIARLLAEISCPVSLFILESGEKGSDDFEINLQRLQKFPAIVTAFIKSEKDFPKPIPHEVVIDALFGSGLNRPLEGIAAKLVGHINHSGCEIISIDIPSGLFIDQSSKGNPVVQATHTLSFQCYKLGFLLPENAKAVGNVHILNIGLHPQFIKDISCIYELVDEDLIINIYKARTPFAHKGNFGHAALVAGSTWMMGAAILCARACLRSGAGKLTCYVSKSGYEIMQTSVPEAMSIISGAKDFIENADGLSLFDSVAVGPGIGLIENNAKLVKNVLQQCKKPVVIDADALNILAANQALLMELPPYSILTPHKKEFERLFGKSTNDFEQIALAQQKAKELNVVIVLKGHHSFIAVPSGTGYFNNTGNAGMAKGGSGDVLTGIIAALLAQHYSAEHAAVLGVYLHGIAGDLAAEKFSQEAMVAGDMINCLGEVFKRMAKYPSY